MSTSKTDIQSAPIYPSQDESIERSYQSLARHFPENPVLDAEIEEYIKTKHEHITALTEQYYQESSKILSRPIVIFNEALNWSHLPLEVPELTKIYDQTMHQLDQELQEIDLYGRNCLRTGISDISAQMIYDLLSTIYKHSNNIDTTARFKVRSYSSYNHYDYMWDYLPGILPLNLQGPDAQPLFQQQRAIKKSIHLKKVELAELNEQISRRESPPVFESAFLIV